MVVIAPFESTASELAILLDHWRSLINSRSFALCASWILLTRNASANMDVMNQQVVNLRRPFVAFEVNNSGLRECFYSSLPKTKLPLISAIYIWHLLLMLSIAILLVLKVPWIWVHRFVTTLKGDVWCTGLPRLWVKYELYGFTMTSSEMWSAWICHNFEWNMSCMGLPWLWVRYSVRGSATTLSKIWVAWVYHDFEWDIVCVDLPRLWVNVRCVGLPQL